MSARGQHWGRVFRRDLRVWDHLRCALPSSARSGSFLASASTITCSMAGITARTQFMLGRLVDLRDPCASSEPTW